MESDNTPHINSLGANPELIHQVALTTRLLQAHPTVNSFHPPGTQTALNQRHRFKLRHHRICKPSHRQQGHKINNEETSREAMQ